MPVDRGERIYVRLRRTHHVLQRSLRHDLYQMLLGENVHWQDREAWIYSKGVYTRYPFQGALYGLPPEVITECIVGADRGATSDPCPTRSGLTVASHSAARPPRASLNPSLIAVRTALASPIVPPGASVTDSASTAANFEEFIYQVWGEGIAKHFALPYNRKLWAVPLSTMETSWLGGRVPLPDLAEMIEGRCVLSPSRWGPMHGSDIRFGADSRRS